MVRNGVIAHDNGGTFTLGIREAEAWLYKFKQCYVALSSLVNK